MNPPRVAQLLLGALAALSCASTAMAGTAAVAHTADREDTGRSIAFELVVDGTPQELFDEWSTAAGVLRFLGSGSRIEERTGGLYEIEFGRLADGTPLGPRDNRILRYEPPAALDVEWTMPMFASELNTTPLPTWVELRFETFGDTGALTLVKLTHRGFGQGDTWDRCYAFFERGWFDILFRLKLHRSYFVFPNT